MRVPIESPLQRSLKEVVRNGQSVRPKIDATIGAEPELANPAIDDRRRVLEKAQGIAIPRTSPIAT